MKVFFVLTDAFQIFRYSIKSQRYQVDMYMNYGTDQDTGTEGVWVWDLTYRGSSNLEMFQSILLLILSSLQKELAKENAHMG